jgi:nucleoside 2-deoxyribosyltransferase
MSNEASIKTVISGSYRKHFSEMLLLKQCLERESIKVMAPVSEEVTNPGEEFALLDADPIHDPRSLQDSIFSMIRRSTFLVVANVDGYLGKAALLEIGYAVAQGIQILTIEDVDDPNISGYTRRLSEVFPRAMSAYGELRLETLV